MIGSVGTTYKRDRNEGLRRLPLFCCLLHPPSSTVNSSKDEYCKEMYIRMNETLQT